MEITGRWPCIREGCPDSLDSGTYRRGFRHCSKTCRAVDVELDRAAAKAKQNPEFTEPFLILVEVADRLSSYHAARATARIQQQRKSTP